MENKFDCPTCECKQNAFRKPLLEKAPNQLCILLQRIKYDLATGAEKTDKIVQFPNSIDLGTFMDPTHSKFLFVMCKKKLFM